MQHILTGNCKKELLQVMSVKMAVGESKCSFTETLRKVSKNCENQHYWNPGKQLKVYSKQMNAYLRKKVTESQQESVVAF